MLACGEHRAPGRGTKDKCVLIVDSGSWDSAGIRCCDVRGTMHALDSHKPQRSTERRGDPCSLFHVVTEEHGKSERNYNGFPDKLAVFGHSPLTAHLYEGIFHSG